MAPRQAHGHGQPIWWLAGAAVLLSVAIQGLVFREFHPVGLIGFSFGFWIMSPRCSNPCGGCARNKRSPQRWWECRLLTLASGYSRSARAGVESYKIEKDVAMKPAAATRSPATISKFVSAGDVRGPNYDAVQGRVEVTRGGKPVTVLQPQEAPFLGQQTFNSKAGQFP